MNTENFATYLDRYKKFFLIVVLCLTAIEVATLLLWWSERLKRDDKIYVATDAGTFLVNRNQMNLRQVWEIKNHTKIAIQDLFENDLYTYRMNLETALNLMDNPMGIKVKDMMDKSGLYDLLRKENAYTKVIFDSIIVIKATQPYELRAYFKQLVMWRGLNQVIPYGVVLTATEDARSGKNPYGLLINHLDLVKYEPRDISAMKSQPLDSLKGTR